MNQVSLMTKSGSESSVSQRMQAIFIAREMEMAYKWFCLGVFSFTVGRKCSHAAFLFFTFSTEFSKLYEIFNPLL